MVDPDAPSPSDPAEREYLHWYVRDDRLAVPPCHITLVKLIIQHKFFTYISFIPTCCIYRLVIDIPEGGGVSHGKQCRSPHEYSLVLSYYML
jgi:hypothetical protein